MGQVQQSGFGALGGLHFDLPSAFDQWLANILQNVTAGLEIISGRLLDLVQQWSHRHLKTEWRVCIGAGSRARRITGNFRFELVAYPEGFFPVNPFSQLLSSSL